jgi:hypothetical protein
MQLKVAKNLGRISLPPQASARSSGGIAKENEVRKQRNRGIRRTRRKLAERKAVFAYFA